MANRKRDAGREALEKKGWWRSHRWLVLRRLCQFFVLGMFLSGPWFGVWILHGNYSSSLLFDTVPLTDPLMTLPLCIGGAGATPPEDCGGVPGYAELVRAMADPNDPEHAHLAEWIGLDSWDPKAFDSTEANDRLAAIRL